MKKLALFDIDGVIYQGHLIFDIVQDSEKNGIIPSGVWEKILLELNEYKSGRKNYKETADSMLGIYANALYGLFYETLFNHSYKYVSENKKKIFGYFPKVLPELKKKYDVYFVTTNFQFTTEAFAKYTGVGSYLSSIAEVKKGIFTGKVKLSLGGNKGIVGALVEKYGRKDSIGLGDSENDADMLKKVEHPFVFEPNEKLKKICRSNNWQVVDRDSAYKALQHFVL